MTDLFAQPTTSADPEAGDNAAYSFDGKPDRWKRYRLPDPSTGSAAGFTRATTFAKTISDTYTLNQWSIRMALKGLAMRPDLLAGVASTPLAEREKLNSFGEQAKTTAGAKEGANLGTALHTFTEQLDRGEQPDVPKPWDRDVKAYGLLMEQEGLEVVPELIEQIVLCEEFGGIAGTFDRIVRLTKDVAVRMNGEIVVLKAGQLVVFDLKTGRDLEYGWLEIAVQLAIYNHAGHIWSKTAKEYAPLPEVRTDVALVLHLPVGKAKATLHAIDTAMGWELSKLCHRVRNARKVKGLATTIGVVDLDEIETDAEAEAAAGAPAAGATRSSPAPGRRPSS